MKAFLFPPGRMNVTPLGFSSTVYTFLWQYFYCTVLSLQFACLSSLCPRYKLLNLTLSDSFCNPGIWNPECRCCVREGVAVSAPPLTSSSGACRPEGEDGDLCGSENRHRASTKPCPPLWPESGP